MVSERDVDVALRGRRRGDAGGARPQRLREVHGAGGHRRAGGAGRGPGGARRPGAHRRRTRASRRPGGAARAAYGAAGPGAAALPPPRRAGERRLRPAQRGHARARPPGSDAQRWLDEVGRGRAGGAATAPALGRAGAAGRRGAGARRGARAAAARRADGGARRRRAAGAAADPARGAGRADRRAWSPTTRSTPCCSRTASSCSTDGRVVEQGTSAEVLSRPRSAFAARLAGLNLRGRHLARRLRRDGRRAAGARPRRRRAAGAGRAGGRDLPARGGGGLPRAGRGQPAQRLRRSRSPRSSRWAT